MNVDKVRLGTLEHVQNSSKSHVQNSSVRKNVYKIPFTYMYKILASSKVIFSRVYKNLSLSKMCTKFLFITHFMYKNPDLGMYKNLGAIF